MTLKVRERDLHPLFGCPFPVLSQGAHSADCLSLDPGRPTPARRQPTRPPSHKGWNDHKSHFRKQPPAARFRE